MWEWPCLYITVHFLGENIKKSLVAGPILEYNSIKRTATVIPGPTDGMWFTYEDETYMKLYYLLLVVDRVPMDNSSRFWNMFSKKLTGYGVYRDAKSCKERVSDKHCFQHAARVIGSISR